MKRPSWLAVVIALNLVALAVLVFVFPHLMVSPGAVMPGHAGIAKDCFACHQPWRGAAANLCIDCHRTADIGIRTTKGAPMPAKAASSSTSTIRASFHQALIEQDCLACHTDHPGPRLALRSRQAFAHDLLQPKTRDLCASCHAAPKDRLHRQPDLACGQCHANTAWKPATFDHDKLFVLDRDHDATCETCHKDADYSRYTCYGCHEHTPANIRAEHEEEGIRNFENCVECHRSADEEPQRQGGRTPKQRGGQERD